jgi:LysR family transcriptional regulator, regulator for bpeEF and oprC
MDRLQAMRVYARIVELGSFTAAAGDLELPRATVTHAISELERRLGTQLLQRTTRRVRTTGDGEIYYAHCRRLLADVDEMEGSLRDANRQPKGRLRVNLPTTLARVAVIPALPEFFARYPEIELELSTDDRFVDLLQEGVDCVLRAGELPDSGLVGRRVALMPQATVASAAYLRRHGRPDSLAALQQGHLAVNWRSPVSRRTESLEFMVNRRRREVQLPGQVSVSGVEAYIACCEAGLGLAQFPRYRIAADLAKGRLLEVLPECPPPPLPLSVLYPPQRHLPQRLRVFVDWLAELIAQRM